MRADNTLWKTRLHCTCALQMISVFFRNMSIIPLKIFPDMHGFILKMGFENGPRRIVQVYEMMEEHMKLMTDVLSHTMKTPLMNSDKIDRWTVVCKHVPTLL